MSECVECGSSEKIHQHHVSYQNDETVPLCISCHREVHVNEDHELYPEDPENSESYYDESFERKTISLPDDLAEYVEEEHLNLSRFVQDKLRERKSDKSGSG